jgi:hypothetical protein
MVPAFRRADGADGSVRGPLVPEIDFQEKFFAASILSGRETVPSIPPGHCCHQKRERVPESGGSSSLTFVMA